MQATFRSRAPAPELRYGQLVPLAAALWADFVEMAQGASP